MNRNTNNFRNPNGDRDPRTGRPDQYPNFSNNYGTIYPPIPVFTRLSPPQPTLEGSRGGYDPPYWRSTEETIIARPLLMGLPLQPLNSRMEIQVLNSNNNRPQITSSSQEARLTTQLNEEKNAVKKLRKEIYNPVPKWISSRLCLYYRDQASRIVNEMEKEREEEEGKRCAVCLEDFEPKEMVMLTPCNHMFHEDCIVPWVKSNAQCPVCRSSIWDPSHGNGISAIRTSTSTNVVPNNNNDFFTGGDLISILRAMGVM